MNLNRPGCNPGKILSLFLMNDNKINTNALFEYWIKSSDNDYQTMIDLFKSKHYHWSLFVGHLVIEKLAKAVYLKKTSKYPPLIHDIRRILEKAGIGLSKEQITACDAITRFNIDARYDDYKLRFYKMCTEEFTTKWIGEIKNLRLWIKKMLSE